MVISHMENKDEIANFRCPKMTYLGIGPQQFGQDNQFSLYNFLDQHLRDGLKTGEDIVEKVGNYYHAEIEIVNPLGLHLRPASDIACLLSEYQADVYAHENRQNLDSIAGLDYDGKSLIRYVSLGLLQNDSFHIYFEPYSNPVEDEKKVNDLVNNINQMLEKYKIEEENN